MKTTLSRRTIPLPKTLLTNLREHRIKQAEKMLKTGAFYQRNDLVFATEDLSKSESQVKSVFLFGTHLAHKQEKGHLI
jgi:hypothetical protein